jgi:phosphatidylserine decarboxylase
MTSPARPDVTWSTWVLATGAALALAYVVCFTRWGWRFAPEGLPFIALALAILGGLSALVLVRPGVAALIGTAAWGVVALWVCSFFRDPRPSGPRGDGYVIAPAQGRIVGVVDADEPAYLGGPATRISIFLSVFDVHVNRYPVSGTVELVRYNKGKFLHAAKDKASLDNEQSTIGLRGPHGPVLVRQIAGSVARRIVTDGKPGDAVRQAERLGLIRFGSRVDVFLPKTSATALRVRVGDRVIVGESVLAEYAP